MKEIYTKTMLYAYPYLDAMIKKTDDKIIKKAIGSMFDISPCEEQCAKVITLIAQKEDLKYLKHLIERMIMKFPFSDFDYFDYKYFKIRPRAYYKDKIKIDRTYYRKQERLLKKFCSIFSAIGGDDQWFEEKFLSIRYINNLYQKLVEKEKNAQKTHTGDKKSNKNTY